MPDWTDVALRFESGAQRCCPHRKTTWAEMNGARVQQPGLSHTKFQFLELVMASWVRSGAGRVKARHAEANKQARGKSIDMGAFQEGAFKGFWEDPLE